MRTNQVKIKTKPEATELIRGDMTLEQFLSYVSTYPYKTKTYVTATSRENLLYELETEFMFSKDRLKNHGVIYVRFNAQALLALWKLDASEHPGLILNEDIVAGPISAWTNLFKTNPNGRVHSEPILGRVLRERLAREWPRCFDEEFGNVTCDGFFEFPSQEELDNRPDYRPALFHTVHLSVDVLTAWLLEDVLRAYPDVYVLRQTHTSAGHENFWRRSAPVLLAHPRLGAETVATRTEETFLAFRDKLSYDSILPALPLSTSVGLIVTASRAAWTNALIDVRRNVGKFENDVVAEAITLAADAIGIC